MMQFPRDRVIKWLHCGLEEPTNTEWNHLKGCLLNVILFMPGLKGWWTKATQEACSFYTARWCAKAAADLPCQPPSGSFNGRVEIHIAIELQLWNWVIRVQDTIAMQLLWNTQLLRIDDERWNWKLIENSHICTLLIMTFLPENKFSTFSSSIAIILLVGVKEHNGLVGGFHKFFKWASLRWPWQVSKINRFWRRSSWGNTTHPFCLTASKCIQFRYIAPWFY